MNELEKVHRIIKREIPEAPHETFLVLDATTGQNAINQAKVFMETANVTGVVLTKLDGTAKGGVVSGSVSAKALWISGPLKPINLSTPCLMVTSKNA